MEHCYIFIYQILHKPTSLTNTKHTTGTHTHEASEKAVKYFEGREGMNTPGWALVSSAGAWGGLWSPPCEGRGMRKTINRTPGPAGFGTSQVIPVRGPSGNCRQQQASEGRAQAAGANRPYVQPGGPFKQPPAACRARGKTVGSADPSCPGRRAQSFSSSAPSGSARCPVGKRAGTP